MGQGTPNPARQFASLVLLIGMTASGAAAIFALAGETTVSLYICGGALVLAVLIVLFGASVVGRFR